MKKHTLTRALAALAAAALLAGCGASSGSAQSTAAYAVEESAADSALSLDAGVDGGTGSAHSALVPEDATAESAQKIIYTADLDLETTDFDADRAKLDAAIEAADAWLEYSSLSGAAEDQDRTANYTVRVPVENYRSFLESAGTAGSVLSLRENAEDVTSSYIDVQARVTALQNQRDRLNELAAQAETTADLIEIENSLSDVQYELESYTQQLRHMDSQISYSTVNVYLDEVATLTPTGTTFAERLGDAFLGGWNSFVAGLQGFVLALVYLWPALVIAAVVIALVVVYRRRHPRRPKPQKPLPAPADYSAPPAAEPPAEPNDEAPKPKY